MILLFQSSGILVVLKCLKCLLRASVSNSEIYTLLCAQLLCLQCSLVQALDQFIKQISEPPTKVAAIGAGCSLATEPTAEISHYWQIPQVFFILTAQRCTTCNRCTSGFYHFIVVMIGTYFPTALMYLIITKFGK